MNDGSPDYHVYRSRKGLLGRSGGPAGPAMPGPTRAPGRPSRLTVRRILVAVVLAICAWLGLSLVLFIISAATAPHEPQSTKDGLAPGGGTLFGANIAVLGLDKRPATSKEPGAANDPPHTDSIMLVHASFGSVRKVSLLRDSYAQIPGVGPEKINAAYAIGGPPLSVKTIQNFMDNGLQINHVITYSFEDFPQFIDSVGGVDVNSPTCIQSQPFGGQVFRLDAGEHHLDGKQALLYARVRENRCAPNEDDRARVLRQQQVLAGVRSRLVSPTTFFRLPWIAWQAPRTIKTDIGPFGLLGLAADFVTGGSGQPQVVQPSGPGPGGSLIVSPLDRKQATDSLLGH